MTKTIFISAGEISGDVHGARLVQEIQKLGPSIRFIGMGHQKMQQAGVKIYADLATVSTIGFLEPLRYLPKIWWTYRKMKKKLRQEKPDLVITIDFQGYHLVLLSLVKRLNIPSVYYISPQEWQWGTVAGGKKVIDVTKLILAIFKEEELFYKNLGGNVLYIGHPILDLAVSNLSKKDFYQIHQINLEKKLVAVFPGTRPQELKNILPVLLKGASLLIKEKANLQLVISIASPLYKKQILKAIKKAQIKDILIYEGNQYDLIQATDLSLLSSGTITLEHACLGVPFVANYRFGEISYRLIKRILAQKLKNIPYISLPNIFANQKIVPELLQDNCTPQNLAKEALLILNDPAKKSEILAGFLTVKQKLGQEGVIKRAAQAIVSFLK